ncbi:single-stranded DNA-binding protein [Roseobacter litoralis]|uniref:single-stranded DNA-binding protein n=1 Tax=Roseobacter litoralis TaxID=42443 RepID=UPI00249435BA|nr:single-stranded DNA-binding protein [Roseobacter litoralis]
MSVNQVVIVGHLGRDPDIKSFSNGGKVANLSVGTSRGWKDRNTGERVERTEWHRVSVTSDFLVGLCESKLGRGDKVYISGRLETRKWQDQSGQDRYSTEVIVAGYEGVIEIFGGSNGNSNSNNSTPGGGHSAPPRDLDDEIPF